MSKLEHVANLRRELAALLEEMMEESALALFARWMLEGRSIPPRTSGNGKAANGAESRKTHSLLADFINGALLAAGSGTAATGQSGQSGQSGKPRSTERGTAEGSNGTGMPLRNAEVTAREHATPHRGDARSERRVERRGPRPARSPALPAEDTH